MASEKPLRLLNLAEPEHDLILTFGDFSTGMPLNDPPTDDEWQLILKFLKREYKKQQCIQDAKKGQ